MECRISSNIEEIHITKEMSGDKFFQVFFKDNSKICIQLENSEIDKLIKELQNLKKL